MQYSMRLCALELLELQGEQYTDILDKMDECSAHSVPKYLDLDKGEVLNKMCAV